MNFLILDTFLDYMRLVSYSIVVLTSLRGIAKRKFSGLLFVGDMSIALGLLITLIIVHLFEISPPSTIVDDIFLTLGAIIWATVHFSAMVRSNGNNNLKKGK